MEEIILDLDFYFPFLVKDLGIFDCIQKFNRSNNTAQPDDEGFEDDDTLDSGEFVYWPAQESYSCFITSDGIKIRQKVTPDLHELTLPGLATEYLIPPCLIIYADDW